MAIYLYIDWAIEQMWQNLTIRGLGKRNIRAIFNKNTLSAVGRKCSVGGPTVET